MAKLFITLAIFCVLGAVFGQEFNKEEILAAIVGKVEECKANEGASDSDIQDMIEKKPASTTEGKCLRACLMEKFELMDNGKFLKEKALENTEKFKHHSEEKAQVAKEIFEACADVELSEDRCEAAEDLGNCFNKEAMSRNIKDDFVFN